MIGLNVDICIWVVYGHQRKDGKRCFLCIWVSSRALELNNRITQGCLTELYNVSGGRDVQHPVIMKQMQIESVAWTLEKVNPE